MECASSGVDGDAVRLFDGSVCAFGVFDGVHRGHRFLLDQARAEAAELGAPFTIITFDVDPDELFHAQRLRKLMPNDDRIALLRELSDAVVPLRFTRDFASLSPERFLEAAFGACTPASLHVGMDIRFGAKAAGTAEDLRAWGAPHGMAVRAHELLIEGDAPITATRIRLLLGEGRIREANSLLGRRYALAGTVLAGRGEGADMGFRTANLALPPQLQTIGDGVYAAYAMVGGERYKAAVNVGVPATFADRSTATCEAHLLDFAGDLYGATILLEFVEWLRPMRKFEDVSELVATVKANIRWVRENL